MRLTFYPPTKPWSLNAERTKHWSWRSKQVRTWRETAYFQALQIHAGELPPSQIHVSLPFDRGGRRDPSNYLPPVKALVDGLVDAGWFVDDDAKHVTVAEPTLRVEKGGLVVVEVQAL
jgi:hypothetical protein